MKKNFDQTTGITSWTIDSWHAKTALVVGYIFGGLYAAAVFTGVMAAIVE